MDALDLSEWAVRHTPSADELSLADRSLLDTVAVALAARRHPVTKRIRRLSEGGGWAAAAHVLDFDDLHIPSTTHISTVCVPAALALGGGPRDFLVGAGVMARVGLRLGWGHYHRGWHSTTTAGALGAAATAASALGLDVDAMAHALAFALPAAGGLQAAFGTDSKSLQVGFAVEAGVRAAELAADGARAEPRALESWLHLVHASGEYPSSADAVPGGLAVKFYPACYALQRPIAATIAAIGAPLAAEQVQRVTVRAAGSAIHPLIHAWPETGLQGKFSLAYGVAAALLERRPGLATFTDAAVRRPEVVQLMSRVAVDVVGEGSGLLDGQVRVDVELDGGSRKSAVVEHPPGAPGQQFDQGAFAAKVDECLEGTGLSAAEITWGTAPGLLNDHLPMNTGR